MCWGLLLLLMMFRLTEVLETLWSRVCRPISENAPYKSPPATSNHWATFARITWIVPLAFATRRFTMAKFGRSALPTWVCCHWVKPAPKITSACTVFAKWEFVRNRGDPGRPVRLARNVIRVGVMGPPTMLTATGPPGWESGATKTRTVEATVLPIARTTPANQPFNTPRHV